MFVVISCLRDCIGGFIHRSSMKEPVCVSFKQVSIILKNYAVFILIVACKCL